MNIKSGVLILFLSISVRILAAEAVPGTRVILEPPAGFERAERFPGFILPEANASIVVNELPAPYSELKEGFTASALAGRGMELLKQEEVTLSAGPGLLMKVMQKAQGREFLKWLMIFGSEGKTILITATYPTSTQSDYDKPLRTTLLGVKLSDGPPPDETGAMTFNIVEKPPLKIVHRLGNAIVLTKAEDKTKDAPLLAIAASITQNLPIAKQLEYAKQRLTKTATISHIKVSRERDTVIDGLHGITLFATARNTETGKELFIMQTMLFDEHGYYLALGMASSDEQEIYQPIFTAIIESFHRIAKDA